MISDENYIVVQIWNETIGVWDDVDEAVNQENAEAIVKQRLEVDDSDTYSIVHHSRTCYGKYAEKS